MPLTIRCVHCGEKTALTEPYPLAGSHTRCSACENDLLVSYPVGAMEKMRKRGKTFEGDEDAPTSISAHSGTPAAQPIRPMQPRSAAPKKTAPPAPSEFPATQIDATIIDPTTIAPGDASHFERTIPTPITPYGLIGGEDLEHELDDDFSQIPEVDTSPIVPAATPPEAAPPSAKKRASEAKTMTLKPKRSTPKKKKVAKTSRLKRVVRFGLIGLAGLAIAGTGVVGGAYLHYSTDLPTIDALRAYSPGRVTEVYDYKGELLGEIYEERRYVLPYKEFPEHLKNAYIAAEDGAFWTHGGVDFMGLGRAIIRNLLAGRKAQGASTITQQVTRNFLLTRDKKIERKIKEILLSWRVEDAYSKEHILFLYLNEIYLGSGAYGVEAASRVYFGKHVQEITLAEAAILAGLPQRPSDYSPHRHWSKARARQEYVLHQMVRNGFITEAEQQAALDEAVTIVPQTNEFLTESPHFTEYIRRYLVKKYGHERVYNEGLRVTTTCDRSLQGVARTAVNKGVHAVDQRMGFRRATITHLSGPKAIKAHRETTEEAIIKKWVTTQDPARRIDVPTTSTLTPGEVYNGVLLEVSEKWARVGIGSHEAIIPLAWSHWVFQPNPRRSWRRRSQTNLTERVDVDGDRKKDGSILQKGDVVLIKVEALSTREKAVKKAFRGTPGDKKTLVAARLWQEPEIEAALLSFDVKTGAVRSMIGGFDFGKSEFNRALQGYRQVGSTFKPLVYGAAIESKKVTTATMVTDGPLAFATSQDYIWKPANYGHSYKGNIPLRKALALSRNTCTVRVLESIDPGMNDDVIYNFARRLGIGGPPLHTLADDFITTPKNDHLCPWTRETQDSTICMDRFPAKDPSISNTRHRKLLKPDDNYQCRTCDLSMGLGSASLTMTELMRAYSAFATDGSLTEPYFVESVEDFAGNLLEKHEDPERVQVISPEVAALTRWLLQGVVNEGTAARARSLGLHLAGKTGTTNDERDAWFIGFNPNVITSVWVGYDTPRPLGVSSTGGRTALPIWMDYMKVAIPKTNNPSFSMPSTIEWANIDETTGQRVTSGGRRYPFLPDTLPESTGMEAGQIGTSDPTEL